MGLCDIIVSMCFIVPMVYTYRYKIYLSMQSELANCQKINDTLHHCSSVIPMFKLLSDNKNYTDVFIQSGTYVLKMSYTLEDLYNVRIRSNASKPAIIRCHNNSDFEAGVAFLRVGNVIIDHLNIVGCGMKHNSTKYLKKGSFIIINSAMYIQNSTNVILVNVNISNSKGIGLLMYDTGGLVNITECTFTDNKLDPLHPNASTSGGGIHIEFTQCSPGLTSCDPYDNPYSSHSKYTIDHCTFKDNTATYDYDGSEVEYFTKNNYITLGTGGGVSLWFNGQAKNNSVKVILSSFINNSASIGGGVSLWFNGQAKSNLFEVNSSNFISNNATTGGGLYVYNRQNSSHNTVKILRCFFIKNISYKEGGGLVIGYVIYYFGGISEFNTYIIDNCLFERNQALTGGGVVFCGTLEPKRSKATNYFEICYSSFVNNTAQFGSAIQINKHYFDLIIVGSIFKLILNKCRFTSNNLQLHSMSPTNSSSTGAVRAMPGVNIQFSGYTYFINQTSTALVVNGATVEFINDSITAFQDNTGLHGGAISLTEGATMTVFPNSTLIFLRNTAVNLGGAIYMELSNSFDYLLSHTCFLRYHLEAVPPSEWETNFTFINNTARQSRSSIFASTLQPCRRAYPSELELFQNKPFYHYPNGSGNRISTLPVAFKFLNNNNKVCRNVVNKIFDLICSVVPGEIFDLPVMLEDELKEKVESAMYIATCTGSQLPNVLHPYKFTNGTIQIAGKPNETCNLQLQTSTCTDYVVSTMAQVNLLSCPPGLVYNASKRQCQCVVDHTHRIPAISDCDITSLRAYYNKYYWIGYKSDDTTMTYAELIFGLCPYHYCYNDYVTTGQLLPRDASKNILDEFVCGDQKRTGLLCGECIEGYSVVMNSPTSRCHKCKNNHLGILYLTLSYILPVSALFYIIMSYNIRMTTGLISAYLFYSQTISSQYYLSSLQANTDLSLTISNILMATYSISNLEFFQHDTFSYCLFANAGTVDILAFKLLLSFYPILLVLIYFLLRCYCICKHHCFQKWRLSSKSVTHGVAAFLVLCFARINILTFGILNNAELFYINGTSYKRMVYLQGNIKYFGEPLYNMYAIASLFIIIIIITFPTMILVVHPILINIAIYFEWGESKFILLINKLLLIHRLKPVLDTFQGDYKDKLHFFAGLHFLLYRIVFFCITALTSRADANRLHLLVTTYFLAILLIHVLTMPFKRFIHNAAYSLICFIMIMVTIIEYHFFATGNSPSELIWAQILLALLPLFGLVLYCSWKLSVSAKAYWKKHKREGSSDHLSLDDYHLLNFPDRMANNGDTDDRTSFSD